MLLRLIVISGEAVGGAMVLASLSNVGVLRGAWLELVFGADAPSLSSMLGSEWLY